MKLRPRPRGASQRPKKKRRQEREAEPPVDKAWRLPTRKEFPQMLRTRAVTVGEPKTADGHTFTDGDLVVVNIEVEENQARRRAYAKVAEIRMPEHTDERFVSGQVFLQLEWLYARGDFDEKCMARTDLEHLGQNEFVQTNDKQIVWLETLESPADVVTFSNTQVNMPPMEREDCYMRVLQCMFGASGRLEKETARLPQICRADCEAACRRQYNPDEHVLRWCDNCGIWQHLDCVTPLDGALPNHTRTNQGYLWAMDEARDERPADFRQVLAWPIQRGDAIERYPKSYELFVATARNWDEEAKAIDGAWKSEMAKKVAEDTPLAVGDVEARLEDLLGEQRPPYYLCAQCETEVI